MSNVMPFKWCKKRGNQGATYGESMFLQFFLQRIQRVNKTATCLNIRCLFKHFFLTGLIFALNGGKQKKHIAYCDQKAYVEPKLNPCWATLS